MLDVRYGPKARWIRAGLFANLCLFGSGASIWAETYVCQLKVAKSERAVLPSSIRIVWPKYLEPARITDTITKLYGHKRVMTQIPVETKKKVVFRWRLDNIPFSAVRSITGYSKPTKVSVEYRATVFSGNKSIIITAIPITTDGSPSGGHAKGQCKLVK